MQRAHFVYIFATILGDLFKAIPHSKIMKKKK